VHNSTTFAPWRDSGGLIWYDLDHPEDIFQDLQYYYVAYTSLTCQFPPSTACRHTTRTLKR